MYIIYQDCVAIIDEWNQYNAELPSDKRTVFMVGENSQYWPEVIVAKKLLDAGMMSFLIMTIWFIPLIAFLVNWCLYN